MGCREYAALPTDRLDDLKPHSCNNSQLSGLARFSLKLFGLHALTPLARHANGCVVWTVGIVSLFRPTFLELLSINYRVYLITSLLCTFAFYVPSLEDSIGINILWCLILTIYCRTALCPGPVLLLSLASLPFASIPSIHAICTQWELGPEILREFATNWCCCSARSLFWCSWNSAEGRCPSWSDENLGRHL